MPAGVYVIELRALRSLTLRIGRLGEVCLSRGTYLYAGSAQVNLPARVGRHLAREKRIRWHIDYLTTHADVRTVRALAWPMPRSGECAIISELLNRGLAQRRLAGFGASDCRCGGHLVTPVSDEWLAGLTDALGTPSQIIRTS